MHIPISIMARGRPNTHRLKGSSEAKLSIDRAAIGGEREQVWYAYGRLTGSGSEDIPLVRHRREEGTTLTVDEFMKELDAAFLTNRCL